MSFKSMKYVRKVFPHTERINFPSAVKNCFDPVNSIRFDIDELSDAKTSFVSARYVLSF